MRGTNTRGRFGNGLLGALAAVYFRLYRRKTRFCGFSLVVQDRAAHQLAAVVDVRLVSAAISGLSGRF